MNEIAARRLEAAMHRLSTAVEALARTQARIGNEGTPPQPVPNPKSKDGIVAYIAERTGRTEESARDHFDALLSAARWATDTGTIPALAKLVEAAFDLAAPDPTERDPR